MSQFVDFPKPETISSGERARRLTLEVERLARLPTVEWMFYLDDTAKAHGITANKLKVMVTAIIKEAEEAKAEAENKAREARADREAASEDLRALPRAEHEAGLARLAARLGADLGDLRDEFAIFAGLADEKEAACEPWPEPVDTRKLINDIMAKLRRYVVVNDDIAIATTLWGMMTWIHNDLAVHSPLLVFHSSTENSGKTTICGVLKYLAPSWKSAAEMTGPTLFRIVDYFRPMLVIEEADELLTRRKDLMHIINSGWTRGTKSRASSRGRSLSSIHSAQKSSTGSASSWTPPRPRAASSAGWCRGWRARRSRSFTRSTTTTSKRCGSNWSAGRRTISTR